MAQQQVLPRHQPSLVHSRYCAAMHVATTVTAGGSQMEHSKFRAIELSAFLTRSHRESPERSPEVRGLGLLCGGLPPERGAAHKRERTSWQPWRVECGRYYSNAPDVCCGLRRAAGTLSCVVAAPHAMWSLDAVAAEHRCLALHNFHTLSYTFSHCLARTDCLPHPRRGTLHNTTRMCKT